LCRDGKEHAFVDGIEREGIGARGDRVCDGKTCQIRIGTRVSKNRVDAGVKRGVQRAALIERDGDAPEREAAGDGELVALIICAAPDCKRGVGGRRGCAERGVGDRHDAGGRSAFGRQMQTGAGKQVQYRARRQGRRR